MDWNGARNTTGRCGCLNVGTERQGERHSQRVCLRCEYEVCKQRRRICNGYKQ